MEGSHRTYKKATVGYIPLMGILPILQARFFWIRASAKPSARLGMPGQPYQESCWCRFGALGLPLWPRSFHSRIYASIRSRCPWAHCSGCFFICRTAHGGQASSCERLQANAEAFPQRLIPCLPFRTLRFLYAFRRKAPQNIAVQGDPSLRRTDRYHGFGHKGGIR